jgi:hypothetical protein
VRPVHPTGRGLAMTDKQYESCARVMASCLLAMPISMMQEKLRALKSVDETLFLLTKHELLRCKELAKRDGSQTDL